ncbi:MAG: hypothetical protein ACT452_03925 [Microthrixaceae bacterium]
MVGSMPYSLEKGPYFSVIEDFANGSRARMIETLAHLRSGAPISQLRALDSTTLDKGPYSTQQLADHLNTDWFGFVKDATGAWVRQPPFDTNSADHTGFWMEWYGDCEAVFRETLIRGCEVSLGLDHGQVPRGQATPRYWPVEIFWRCPIPWFEGWVTWRRHGTGAGDGQVTLLISTPGHGHPLRNTPLRQNEPAGSGYARDASRAEGPQGMWVVSQSYHRPWPSSTTAESGLGEWRFPTQGLAYESQGPVVVVAPPEREGGVLNPPRHWNPHP